MGHFHFSMHGSTPHPTLYPPISNSNPVEREVTDCTSRHPQQTTQAPTSLNSIKCNWLLFLSNLRVDEWWKIGLGLAYQSHFSEEDLRLIFSREAQVRLAVEQAQQVPYFQIHPSIVNLYRQVLKPLANQAKSFLINRTAYTTFVAATEKGLALQTGIQAIKRATLINADLSPELSSQEVYLLPPFSVIKKCNERAEEEESLMEGLFAFQIKRGLLSSAKIARPILKRWGISLATTQDISRGYYYSALEQDRILKASIFKRLHQHSQELYESWIEDIPTESDNLDVIRNRVWTYQQDQLEESLTMHQLWEKHQANLLNMDALILPFNQTVATLFSKHWLFRDALMSRMPPANHSFTFTYQQPAENARLSFRELQGRYLRGKLNPEATIQELGQTIQDLILNGSDLGKALTKGIPVLDEPLLTPAFPNLSIQQAFEACEKKKWIYRVDETAHCTSFKELFRQFLIGNRISNLKAHSSNSWQNEIKQALYQTRWKLIMPELYFYRRAAASECEAEEELDLILNPADSLYVKPFLNEMILLENLIENPPLFEAIQKRIDERSQYKVFLTSLFQCLDLYHKNIGVAPCSNLQAEKFKNTTFTIYDYSNEDMNENQMPDGEQRSFDELRKDYLLERIFPETWIAYHDENEHLVVAQLAHLTLLSQALNSQWEWVFFDFDLCLGESNTFQKVKWKTISKTLIPLRSAFLSLAYKHEPLNAFTLAQIENGDERNAQMDAWIKRLDAPIRKRLSKNVQKQIDALLAILLQRPAYSISQTREDDEEGCLKTIQARFAVDLAEMQDSHQQMIWELLEQELSHASIYKNETYESLAKRHKQDVEQLRVLNQNQALIPGCQAKISYSLTKEEDKKRRFKIGCQLFPRLTWKQQKALSDRQAATKNYLQNFRRLQEFMGTPQETLELLKKFIHSPLYAKNEAHAMAHEIQTKYLQFLQNPFLLKRLKSLIERQCQPSLFNLMAVMYPHLKDSYALTTAWINISHATEKPGNFIGDYNYPLERLIKDVQAKYSPSSDAYKISQALEQAIQNEKDPYLFFVF